MNADWTLMSSHGVILSFVVRRPNATLREIARELGVTEMHVFTSIRDMANDGILRIEKAGRRNCYIVNREARFRHPWLSHISLGDFFELLYEPIEAGATAQ